MPRGDWPCDPRRGLLYITGDGDAVYCQQLDENGVREDGKLTRTGYLDIVPGPFVCPTLTPQAPNVLYAGTAANRLVTIPLADDGQPTRPIRLYTVTPPGANPEASLGFVAAPAPSGRDCAVQQDRVAQLQATILCNEQGLQDLQNGVVSLPEDQREKAIADATAAIAAAQAQLPHAEAALRACALSPGALYWRPIGPGTRTCSKLEASWELWGCRQASTFRHFRWFAGDSTTTGCPRRRPSPPHPTEPR